MAELPWCYKYAPTDVSSLLLDEKIVHQVTDFIENFSRATPKKAIFLYGPTGTGKTTLAYTIANSTDSEIVEINASDTRNKKSVKARIGAATQQMSLFATKKIILIDEVDAMSGRYDRGGVLELIAGMKVSPFPFIITAQDPWDSKLSKLRAISKMVELKQFSQSALVSQMKTICLKENISFEDQTLSTIAINANGDLRAAINDLQSSVSNGTLHASSQDGFEGRDITSSIPDALRTVFKSKDLAILKEAFAHFEGNFDDVFMWEEYNLPSEYKESKALADAYDALSMADVFKGRIRRWQYWRFLVYINLLLSVGVGISKEQVNSKFVSYKQSSLPLKIWMSNRKFAKRNDIAGKLVPLIHHSKTETIKNFRYFELMCHDKQFVNDISELLDLDVDQKKWLKARV